MWLTLLAGNICNANWLPKLAACVIPNSCLLARKNDVSFALFPRSREPVKDGVIATFDEHEDSVYAVEWSTADPWVFASLSYDGRLVINRVPRAEKYKILL